MGPAQVHAFGEDNEMAALAARIANDRFGSLKIGRRLSPLNEHLGHANSEFHNYLQAAARVIFLEIIGLQIRRVRRLYVLAECDKWHRG